MSHKKIYSPMFDVRPRETAAGQETASAKNARADLLWQKKQRTDVQSGRVVDLSLIKPGDLFVVAKEIKKQKRRRGKKENSKNKNIVRQSITPMALFEQFSPGREWSGDFLETVDPKRANILFALDKIEAMDRALKDYSWRVESNLAAIDNLPDVSDLVDVDIDKYLWLEENITPIQKKDILDELLSQSDSDIEDAVGANIEIAVNLPSPSVSVAAVGQASMGQALLKKDKAFSDFSFIDKFSLIPNSKKSLGAVGAGEVSGASFLLNDAARNERRNLSLMLWRRAAGFLSAGFLIYLVIFGMSLTGRGLLAKENILSSALQAYKSMLAAKDSASVLNFSAAGVNFEQAYQNFLDANQELNDLGRGVIYILEKLPGGEAVGSGAALVGAGENFAKVGQSFSKIADIFLIENLGDYFLVSGPSLTQKIAQAQDEINSAQFFLAAAGNDLNKVNPVDLPADAARQVASLKEKMPSVVEAAGQLKIWSDVFLDVLGHWRAQKYLLVFQNNSEARATGGFIGTYGVVALDEGRMKNLFIDGIFNLDGQLYDKVIPPRPIQKISTAWSTHDANWFPDWPASARKIMDFYEKAGGATTDGVISLTPTVIERLLAVIGPIDMPQYDVALDQNNFLDLTQYKVEVDYDKEQNRPKKILADFAPLFLDKLWQVWPERGQEILEVLTASLAEKHILFYFSDPALEKIFVDQGWAGEILQTDKDYLSVINTNINGYKTDRVIEQKIFHSAAVQNDGSIIDSVKITRTHKGGGSRYDWYNKVNSDYLRVYAPLGSKLLAARGYTLETYSAPIDYVAQNFKVDADVARQEQTMAVDADSGTQIFEESGKTVFGNWVYVSPGESVEITYQYLLPFKLNLNDDSASYSLMAQKQSGSAGSEFSSILQLPEQAKVTWQYPGNLQIDGPQIKFSDNLQTDKFYGVVLTR